MRAVLKDARMREQAGAIRKELALLYADVDRLGTRVAPPGRLARATLRSRRPSARAAASPTRPQMIKMIKDTHPTKVREDTAPTTGSRLHDAESQKAIRRKR